VARVVKTNRPNLGLRPELAPVGWAAAQSRVWSHFDVPASFAAANVPPSRGDTGSAEGPAEYALEVKMSAQHPAI